MTVRNSIKQLFRTPIKTIGFLLLIILAVSFMVLGASLWYSTTENIKAMDKAFRTIVTAEQEPESYGTLKEYNEYEFAYTHIQYPVYGNLVLVSELQGLDVDYVSPPEHRPIYAGYNEQYRWYPYGMGSPADSLIIAEVVFDEDSDLMTPTMATITKMINGNTQREGNTIFFCNHEYGPTRVEKGKTYVAYVGDGQRNTHDEYDVVVERSFLGSLASSQYDKQTGLFMESEYKTPSFPSKFYSPWLDTERGYYGSPMEVTEGVYDSKEGQHLLATIEMIRRSRSMGLITPVSSTNYLMDFYWKETNIYRGRDITEEEYASGKKVCLISEEFAQLNHIDTGDKINFSIYAANYYTVPIYSWDSEYINTNAEGEAYPFFEDVEYEIVGIYRGRINLEQVIPAGFERTTFEVIVPANSIENSDENNIIDYGIMRAINTTFEIKNGTRDEFLAKAHAAGIDNLNFTFYDGGYMNLIRGINNLHSIAILLLGVGIVATLSILIFFIYLLVSKQKKRTAIERSMGMSKGKCFISLLAGIMFIAVLGAGFGSAVGFMLTDIVNVEAVEAMESEEAFSTKYSNGALTTARADTVEEQQIETISATPIVPITMFFAVILVAFMVSAWLILSNLRSEPMKLLSERME